MTAQTLPAAPRPRQLGRSALAVIAGFLTVVVLSLGTDQWLHMLHVYPPWGQPMHAPELNLLALAYRLVYTVLGGYVTARLAPHSPMRHAWILGFVGLFFGIVGAMAAIPMDLGPAWYPVAIVLTALPCTWLGGRWRLRQSSARRSR
ncbi:hypothetical protein M2650_15280 [Luteimonas sp. SX5]|uniref:DUF4345 domain-containing protein n=1 Tax=Luteimonas galliterrae TaxID=2940486 RepID=A0ABT0MM72_9GAMM|nr:hypothetical protein [Luteimonas galliterrae]MCL1635985.1 hypothetical protein [Luteimonas galliterrae]